MSDDTREATSEEKRVIIAHDCALEILTLPPEERQSVLEAIVALVRSPATTGVFGDVGRL